MLCASGNFFLFEDNSELLWELKYYIFHPIEIGLAAGFKFILLKKWWPTLLNIVHTPMRPDWEFLQSCSSVPNIQRLYFRDPSFIGFLH